jgi:hypothetical protein
MRVNFLFKERRFLSSIHYYPFFKKWGNKETFETLNVICFEPVNFKNYITMDITSKNRGHNKSLAIIWDGCVV